ncbi:FMN-binding protein MioC, partial [Klebsiella variicola]|uniref:FMN-binding protein MioC n=1 Tax=Klebsiella variicola TaxID=244366 RepID=UPI001E4C157E
MADITLISGSTLGSAEYVAEHLAEKLEEAGYSTEIQHGPLVDDLQAEGIWLVISSTHGAGDIPDNLVPFYDALLEQKADLSAVRFGAIGIGSREYDTFCGAIEIALGEVPQGYTLNRIPAGAAVPSCAHPGVKVDFSKGQYM